MEDLDVTTVEEVNNSLRVQYKQQKRLINNLLLIIVFWLLMFLLATLLTVGTDIVDKVILFGGLSVVPILLFLLIQFANINKLNKYIKELNLQKEIFTEQILEKEKTFMNKMKTDKQISDFSKHDSYTDFNKDHQEFKSEQVTNNFIEKYSNSKLN